MSNSSNGTTSTTNSTSTNNGDQPRSVSDPKKRVVDLRVTEGLTPQQIADRMNEEAATIRAWLAEDPAVQKQLDQRRHQRDQHLEDRRRRLHEKALGLLNEQLQAGHEDPYTRQAFEVALRCSNTLASSPSETPLEEGTDEPEEKSEDRIEELLASFFRTPHPDPEQIQQIRDLVAGLGSLTSKQREQIQAQIDQLTSSRSD